MTHNNKTKRRNDFIALLNHISPDIWNAIVENEPEWKYFQSFLSSYGFGRFAVLQLMIGLNSYQLKGTAEQNYWQKLSQHLKAYPPPQTINELQKYLYIFYKKERLPNGKIKRLQRFLSSSLAQELWSSTPLQVQEEFQQIWQSLTKVMQQKKEAKTICFAMKCLGVTLLMLDYGGFDFSCICIPVDSRVTHFTQKAGFVSDENPASIRECWQDILNELQQENNRITMIHLDSLIWQIGTLTPIDMRSYLSTYHIESFGEAVLNYMSESSQR